MTIQTVQTKLTLNNHYLIIKWKSEAELQRETAGYSSLEHSGITGGGGGYSDIFHREIFADLPGKEDYFKGKSRKEGKFERVEEENWKCKGKTMKMWKWVEDLIFLSFFPLLVFFEVTKICLGSTKMEIFYREKAYFTPGKKIRKSDFAPSEKNIPLTPLLEQLAQNQQHTRRLTNFELSFCDNVPSKTSFK